MEEEDFLFEAQFLNRHQFVEAIKELFKSANKEILVLVPYIKVSDLMWNEMKKAESENKHIVIVYRKDSMPKVEKDKLLSLTNLTLLHHPHIHSKCYVNENLIIIGSMNLYEHSELNNREMGVITSREAMDEIYIEALDEIQSIINASTLEKKSELVEKSGFKIELLETEEDVIRKYLDEINKVFINKKFEIIPDEEGYAQTICKSYYENIDVSLEFDTLENSELWLRRIVIELKFDQERKSQLQQKFWREIQGLDLDEFRVYWYKRKDTFIYRDDNHSPKWTNITFNESVHKFKQGLDKVINFISNS